MCVFEKLDHEETTIGYLKEQAPYSQYKRLLFETIPLFF
jgi:hypothetical protein